MATYQIKRGDNLTKIAAAHGTTVDELVKANNISNPNKIYAGATLNIPDAQPAPAAPGPAAAPEKTTADYLKETEAAKPGAYQQSQAVIDATKQLTDFQQTKPGEYQSQYGDQIQELLEKILNREKFTYDFNADPLYQQYKDQYMQQGQQAMMDTMANAATLTGGYGNSYASTAGQQMYQGHLQQLNNVIPELQQAAYGMYQAEGDQMNSQLGTLQGLDESDYGRHRDAVGDFYTERDYLTGQLDNMSEDEYRKFLDSYDMWAGDRDYLYQKTQDEQDQKNWQTQWDYQLQQDAAAAAAKGGGGGGGGGSKKTSYGPQYNSVLAASKNKKGSALTSYLDSMVSKGYITEAGADRILYAELGLTDDEVFGGGSGGSSGGSGGSSGSKAPVSSGFTGQKNGLYYVNGKQVLYPQYKAMTGKR